MRDQRALRPRLRNKINERPTRPGATVHVRIRLAHCGVGRTAPFVRVERDQQPLELPADRLGLSDSKHCGLTLSTAGMTI
jgi:hypothetical protein